ncbi:MAG: helix-turn-helix domain-containing protein [Clostridium sp.]|nr:helix-turn-helix domain-containing protein [Clostridium sp.]
MIELNVLELLKKKGKTKYWLFNQLEMSYTNFNNIVMNRTKSIKYENIDKFCKILDCKPNDLFKIK